MHALTDESVLPRANATAAALETVAFERAMFDDPDRTPAASARTRSLGEWQQEVEWLPSELPAEPSGETLVAAFGAGGLCGVLGAALLLPAMPALAFGGALGAYAGVLAASLWVSRSTGALR